MYIKIYGAVMPMQSWEIVCNQPRCDPFIPHEPEGVNFAFRNWDNYQERGLIRPYIYFREDVSYLILDKHYCWYKTVTLEEAKEFLGSLSKMAFLPYDISHWIEQRGWGFN